MRPGQGPVATMPMRPDATLVRILIGYMFVRIVTELKIYRIYEAVLRTIKIATHNLSVGIKFYSIIQ
jgi:hypothetical protein